MQMRKKGKRGKIMDISLKELCVYLGLFLCCEMFMVIMTSHYVNEYSGERLSTAGILQSVSFKTLSDGCALEIGVNGREYEISKMNNILGLFSFDFGIEGNYASEAIGELQMYLEGEIGKLAHIEYVHVNGDDTVLGLTIGNTQYLNADEVLEDHITYHTLGRNIFAIAFVITLIPFVILLLRVLRAKPKPSGDRE